MIVILNGPLGVGKTETAWKLIDYWDRAAILDLDYAGANLSHFDIRNPEAFRSAVRTATMLAKYQKSRGVQHFVLNYVFENEEQLAFATSLLSEVTRPVHSFLLLCDARTLETRVRQRMHEDVDREVTRAKELHEMLSASNNLGIPLDTSSLSVAATAEAIWNALALK